MKRLLLLAVFSAMLLWCNAQNEIAGKIKEANTGLPIQGVSVYIPDLKLGAVSDSSGSFFIKNIPSGSYLIEISSIGFAAKSDEIVVKGVVHLTYELSIFGFELQEAIVTGVPTATQRQKNPQPVSILAHQDLQQNVYSNIIDAVASIPGVSQITDGLAISKPVVRGLGYNRVVVINDGIRQEGQQWGDEFGIEVDENTVEKAEILKGPASLSYGSDAMAGVINFLSPNPLAEGRIKADLLLNYQTNNGLYHGSADFAGNQNGFIWDLRYTFKQAHDYKNKYDGYVWNSAYGENDFKGILGVNRKWGYSHLHLSYFGLKLGIVEGARDPATGEFTKHFLASDGSDSMDVAPEDEYKKYNFYPIIHQHVKHYKAVLDNSFNIGKGRLLLRLGYQQNFRREANDITEGDVYNNYFFLRTINYDLQYVFSELKKWQVSIGANGMGQHSEDRGFVYLVPEYNSFDVGLFSIVKKTFDKLTISGGARFDTRTFHGKNLFVDSDGVRLPGPALHSVHRFTAYHSDFSGFSGSIGLTYDFTKHFYGKLNLARGFRAPNIAESGSDGLHDGTPFYEIGDPNLKPENSLQVDATLGVNTEDYTAELNAFRNKINHYIFPSKLESVNGGDSLRNDPTVDPDPHTTFKYIAGDAVLSGGEIFVDIHPHTIPWFHFENAYSYVRAIQSNQNDSTKFLPYTPPGKLQSKLRFTRNKINGFLKNGYFILEVDHFFTQDKIYYKFGDETVTPGYTLINAGFGVDINSQKRRVCSFFFNVNNLFDEGYQSNMSRLKYGDLNPENGRIGVFNMGRNFIIKLLVPIEIK